MRRVQSYRHSSKNLTWSIFSEILPVRFKLTNSNNRNGIFTKNPSCFWNHTHTNVLSIQLILTPGFSYLQTVTQETNHLLVLKRSVSEVWMKRSGEWQIRSCSPGTFFIFDDTGPPFNDFIYWMIPFWLNLSYSIHSLQRLFTYNLRHFSLALSNHCSADGNVRGLAWILKSRNRILECMLTKKVGFELGTWSKNYLAFIARREYEALNE